MIVIEPGLIKTRFGDTAAGSIEAPGDGHDPYAEFDGAVGAATAGIYEGALARLGGGPETVARAIERAISASHPRTRYRVTPSARLTLLMRRLVPDRLWDALMRNQLPSPGSTT